MAKMNCQTAARLFYQDSILAIVQMFSNMTCSGDDEMPPRVSPVSPATAKAAVSEMRIGTRVSIKGLQGPKHLPEASRRLRSLMHLQPSFAGEFLGGPNIFRNISAWNELLGNG